MTSISKWVGEPDYTCPSSRLTYSYFVWETNNKPVYCSFDQCQDLHSGQRWYLCHCICVYLYSKAKSQIRNISFPKRKVPYHSMLVDGYCTANLCGWPSEILVTQERRCSCIKGNTNTYWKGFLNNFQKNAEYVFWGILTQR